MEKLYEKYDEIIAENAQDYDNVNDYLQEVVQYGCINGAVEGLIYFNEIIDMYNEYADEYQDYMDELRENTGMKLSDIYNEWDDDIDSTYNKQLIVWSSFETYCAEKIDQN